MPRNTMSNILRAAASTPWAILPEKLTEIAAFLELRAAGVRFSAEEIAARVGDARPARPTPPASIAVLPLYGIIAHRANQVNDISGPGGTSTQQFGAAFDAAIANEEITAVVLDVDSPGGTIDGVEELARKIFDARGRKPIVASVNTMAASAAYWIASAADEIVVTPTGEVGSIGVYMIHLDASKMYEAEGLDYTLISAGKYKTEGNSFEPLTEDARAALQLRVDEAYDMFVKAVGRGRGVSPAGVRKGFGQGRVVSAKAGVAEGMADRVATFEETIDRLAKRSRRTPAGRAALVRTRLALDEV